MTMDVAEIWDAADSGVTSELAAASQLLLAHIKADRIVLVTRRLIPDRDGRSSLDLARAGDGATVLELVEAMFAFEDVNG